MDRCAFQGYEVPIAERFPLPADAFELPNGRACSSVAPRFIPPPVVARAEVDIPSESAFADCERKQKRRIIAVGRHGRNVRRNRFQPIPSRAGSFVPSGKRVRGGNGKDVR